MTYRAVEGTSYNAEDILAEGNANPDTTDWFEYTYSGVTDNVLDIKGSVLDVSTVIKNEAAGSHGAVAAVNDSFVFEDGTEARFWGTDICGSACFPSYAFAPVLADAIAASGFNLVRFHHMDNAGKLPNIFGATADSGPDLSTVQLNKLCYFIKLLKDRGIYYYMDQTVYRKVYDDDGIPSEGVSNGLKGPLYHDEAVIAIQNEYSRQLMTYDNKWTGYKIGTDPALVMVDLVNEYSLISDEKLNRDNGGRYYTKLKAKFNEWLKTKYSDDRELEEAWEQSGKRGLRSGESMENGTVEVEAYFERRDLDSDRRDRDTVEFLTVTEETYFTERTAYLRSLGVACPITGSTIWSRYGNENMYSVLYANRNSDFTDSHHYLNHPDGGWSLTPGTRSGKIETILDDSTLGFFGKAANLTAYGKPRVISEWNICDPVPYIGEGILMMSAMGAMQGWHPIMFQFTETDRINSSGYKEGTYISDFLSADIHPARLAMMTSAAIAFRRGDITEAERGFYKAYGTDWYSKDNQKISDDAGVAMIGKTGTIVGTSDGVSKNYLDETISEAAETAANGDKIYRSVTEELVFNLKDKAFSINTPKTQAISGCKTGCSEASSELSDVDIAIDNKYATVIVNSLDDKPISESGKMLLTTVGQVWNSGQVLRRDGTGWIKAGTSPVLCEPICGTVTIHSADNFEVYALNSSGERVKAVETEKTAEGYTLIGLKKDNKTMNYEIVKSNAGN